MSYSGSWNDNDGDFLLVVSGPTRSAPYLAGWQEFKDHLRKVVKEQPGWADVLSSQSQRRGDPQGWCRLKYREDADAAYKVYYRSKGVLVHVWETCRRGSGFRLMRCNCSSHFPEISGGGHSEGRCGIDIGRVSQLSGKAPAVSTTPYMTAQSPYPYAMHPQAPAYTATPTYPAHVSPTPIYSTSTNGIPVDVRGGAVLTEARSIFIRNLSYKVTPEELAKLLSTVGHPVHSNLHRDSRTGAFKGVATAKFSSTEEAQYAVTYLNRRQHMGMTLSVRMDVDTTVVGRAEPMVVNGTSAYAY